MNPFLLLLIGLLLIFLEFYLPGAVMGTVGVIALIAGVVVFALQAESLLEVFLFLLGTGLGVYLVIRLALTRIKGTAKKQTIYLESDQEGFTASSFDQRAIGKKGVALSDLKPSGFALIEGKQLQVMSQSGYVTEGTEITVIGGQGAVLIVKPTHKEAHT